jgi:hypothetical protein
MLTIFVSLSVSVYVCIYCQVKEIDGDDSKYWAMVNAPVVASNQV